MNLEPQAQKLNKTAATKENTSSLGLFEMGLGLLIGAAALALLASLWFSGLGVLAAIEYWLREWTYALILLIIPLLLSFKFYDQSQALKLSRTKIKDSVNRAELTKRANKFTRISYTLFLLPVLALAYGFFVHPYLVASSYAKESVSTNEPTNYAERAPWLVANNYAERDQGDLIGDREDVHYVPLKPTNTTPAEAPEQNTSRYTVLVRERGMLGTGGYVAVQTLAMPTKGPIPASASSYCETPGMSKRLESFWPWHSLAWSISAKAPFAHYEIQDAYGYCNEHNQALIVVPLFSYSGFWNVTKVPNGAALYSAEGLEILSAEQLVEREIEGPSYPRTLAKIQRESINAGAGITQWWGSKYGFDLTNEDSEDSNAANPSEFLLLDASEQLNQYYVTPLTPRGSSQSITAISEISASQSVSKQRNQVKINNSPDLPATSTLTTAIKESSVAGDNAWTTRWSAGMFVYEILPSQNGHFVASIGQGQAVSYRADIYPDGSVTVVNAETGQSSKFEPTNSVAGTSDLSELSREELLQLIEEAVEELKKREGS